MAAISLSMLALRAASLTSSMFTGVSKKAMLSAMGGALGIEGFTPFCSQNSDLKCLVEEFINESVICEPNHVLADVCYVGRIADGDVLARPNLLPFEIVLSTRSAIAPDLQLTIDDLDVYLHDGRFQ